MHQFHLKYLALFLIVLGCSAFGGENSDAVQRTGGGKIDPALSIEIERLKADGRMDQEIEVLVRTRTEIAAPEREAIERRGGKIGAILGDVLTVRIPARSVPEIAELEFVIHIEKSKKERPRRPNTR